MKTERSGRIKQCPKCSWYSIDGKSHLSFCPDYKPAPRPIEFGFDDGIDLETEEELY